MNIPPRSEGKPETVPTISVIMANYNGARYIEQALRSVLAQSFTDFEVLVADDASTDDSVERVLAVAARDARIRLLRADRNGGPARTRNRALDAARGTWIAIVDADDLIHPERFERLLAAAHHLGADIVADDLLQFYEDGSPSECLLDEDSSGPLDVSVRSWISAGDAGTPALGYLKPILRASRLSDLRYDEGLRIGEDYDLVLRMLMAGAIMKVLPEPWYFYRRHERSTSHRLSVADLIAMIESQRRFTETSAPLKPEIVSALQQRMSSLQSAFDYERLVHAIKRRDISGALWLVARRPGTAFRLVKSASKRLRRSEVQGQPALRGGEFVLGESAGSTLVIPPYRLPTVPSWGGGDARRIWRRVADLALGQARLTFEGRAGAYAAGFALAAGSVAAASPSAVGTKPALAVSP